MTRKKDKECKNDKCCKDDKDCKRDCKKCCGSCCGKVMFICTIFLIVTYAILGIAQIWGQVFAMALFAKISMTYGIILVTLGLVWLVGKYFCDEARLKKEKYHD